MPRVYPARARERAVTFRLAPFVNPIRAIRPAYLSGAIHRLADDIVGRLGRAGLLYRRGFGDRALLDAHVDDVRSFTRKKPFGSVHVRWETSPRDVGPYVVQVGQCPSPSLVPLPVEARVARFEVWLPRRTHRGPMCVLLASTAEEGFARRRVFARHLLAAGIGALLLENPFYGTRRPKGQLGPALRTVEEQFAMNLATVDEGRAFLKWLCEEGYAPVGVSGYSQGGFMTAFVAAHVDFPVVAVPRGAGTSAVPVFTRSALSEGVAWSVLAAQAGSERAAREAMVSCLTAVDVTLLPPPVAPELATVVAVRHDRFVPPDDMQALHRHWPGSHLIWSEAGHISSALFDGSTHARAVVGAFARAT